MEEVTAERGALRTSLAGATESLGALRGEHDAALDKLRELNCALDEERLGRMRAAAALERAGADFEVARAAAARGAADGTAAAEARVRGERERSEAAVAAVVARAQAAEARAGEHEVAARGLGRKLEAEKVRACARGSARDGGHTCDVSRAGAHGGRAC